MTRRPERPEDEHRARRSGAIVLVGTPIGNLGDLSPRAIEALRAADVIAAEDTRRTRGLLAHARVPAAGRLRAVHAHNEVDAAKALIDEAVGGARVVVVSDAGMPGVSDPGSVVVAKAIEAGVPVEVVPGPSAVLTALVLSGLATERFVFEGFLPRKGRSRTERIAALATEPRTAVLFESPRRVRAPIGDLATMCGEDRPVAITRELTKKFEETWRGSLADASRHLELTEPRGEYTIVLGPALDRTEPPSNAEIEDALRAHLSKGDSVRDAAAGVADQLGIPRRRAYELATALSRERS
jgi:16S rRNA (cytidine1402-2'-O)-methyltransferase